jgi:hypothetical protein
MQKQIIHIITPMAVANQEGKDSRLKEALYKLF